MLRDLLIAVGAWGVLMLALHRLFGWLDRRKSRGRMPFVVAAETVPLPESDVWFLTAGVDGRPMFILWQTVHDSGQRPEVPAELVSVE